MAVPQVRQKANLIGSYYVKPQRTLNSVVAEPLTSLPTRRDFNLLVVSESEMQSFRGPPLRLVKGKCFQNHRVRAARLQKSGWKFTRVQTISASFQVQTADSGAFRTQFLTDAPESRKFSKPVRPAWLRSIVLMMWIPVFFYFWSRLSFCLNPRTLLSSIAACSGHRTHVWEEVARCGLNCVPPHPPVPFPKFLCWSPDP